MYVKYKPNLEKINFEIVSSEPFAEDRDGEIVSETALFNDNDWLEQTKHLRERPENSPIRAKVMETLEKLEYMTEENGKNYYKPTMFLVTVQKTRPTDGESICPHLLSFNPHDIECWDLVRRFEQAIRDWEGHRGTVIVGKQRLKTDYTREIEAREKQAQVQKPQGQRK